jgi:hypothetical protein
MLFEVPLVDILPLIKCKPEAETVVSLKIHLAKLGHVLDAFAAEDVHRQTLIRLRSVAATAAAATTSTSRKREQGSSQGSSRAATLHSILDSTVTAMETKDDLSLKNVMTQLLEGLFHIEVDSLFTSDDSIFCFFCVVISFIVLFSYDRDHCINMPCKTNHYHKN